MILGFSGWLGDVGKNGGFAGDVATLRLSEEKYLIIRGFLLWKAEYYVEGAAG